MSEKVKRGPNSRLRVAIEGQEIVVRIGIETMRHATEHSPHFYDYDVHGASEGPYLKVTDDFEFACDVVRALQFEEEDGSGPLSDLLDQAAERAIDDGSNGVDYEWKPVKK